MPKAAAAVVGAVVGGVLAACAVACCLFCAIRIWWHRAGKVMLRTYEREHRRVRIVTAPLKGRPGSRGSGMLKELEARRGLAKADAAAAQDHDPFDPEL